MSDNTKKKTNNTAPDIKFYNGLTFDDVANLGSKTVRQLKEIIRAQTRYINEAVAEARKAGNLNPVVEKAYGSLLSYGTGNRNSKQLTLGFTYKSKVELIEQASKLKSFIDFDVYTPAGQIVQSEKLKRQFESFKYYTDPNGIKRLKKDHVGIGKKTYEQLVHAMGALGPAALEKIDSDFFVDIYHKASKKRRVNLVKIANDALKKGGTQEDIQNMIRDAIV